VKVHHIGIVCEEENIKNYFFIPKKKYTYIDKFQNNKLIIGFNKPNNIWFEFIVPLNKNSTVKNFLKKKGPSIHHLAYFVKDIDKIKRNLLRKRGYIFVNSFNMNIPCFGGLMDTVFFFNNNIFLEFISKAKR